MISYDVIELASRLEQRNACRLTAGGAMAGAAELTVLKPTVHNLTNRGHGKLKKTTANSFG